MRTFGNAALLSMLALMVSGSPLEQPRSTTSLREDTRQPRLATGGAPASSVTGTIRLVDLKGRTVEVIAGVGHALRLARIHVSPECSVSIAGTTGRFEDLRRGDTIRVDYRETPQGHVADRIETICEASQGGWR